jgi:hypothetical protein
MTHDTSPLENRGHVVEIVDGRRDRRLDLYGRHIGLHAGRRHEGEQKGQGKGES